MSASVVQLVNRDNGRRYTPEEREVALMVWMGEGSQNLTRTAQLTGVSRFTLMKWQEQDDWKGRLEGIGTARNEVAKLASAMLPHLWRAATGAWLEILTNPKANDNARVKLIEMTYGMYGMVVPKQSVSVIQHLTDQADKTVVSMKDLLALEPDQLAAWDGASEEQGEGEE
jgi:hypothetical protein